MKYYPDGDVEHQLNLLLNDGLEIGDNMRGALVEFTTSGGKETIQHALGYEPFGWIVMYKDGSVELYDEGTAWTSEFLYLTSSATSVTVRLFVV